MATRQQQLKPNRYKKSNGKGGIVLAVLVLLVCLVITGIGFMQYRNIWHNSVKPLQQQEIQKQPLPQQPAPSVQTRSSSSVSSKPVELVPLTRQEPYYTGDPHPDKAPSHPHVSSQPATTVKRVELAVLVDDMGSSMQEARALAAIGVPISFAVIPGLRLDKQVATFAREQGIDVLIHMPMQSKEYPLRRLESNGLLLEYSDEELAQRINNYIEQVPGAVGANNHMGSGFTERADKMRIVLQVLKKHNLFFLDSVTTPQTTGLQIASELKLPKVRRDVFLDNEQHDAYIRGQLQQAVAKAKRQGQAVAICHPHPATIATLTHVLPGLKQQGVTLVVVSKLVR